MRACWRDDFAILNDDQVAALVPPQRQVAGILVVEQIRGRGIGRVWCGDVGNEELAFMVSSSVSCQSTSKTWTPSACLDRKLFQVGSSL